MMAKRNPLHSKRLGAFSLKPRNSSKRRSFLDLVADDGSIAEAARPTAESTCDDDIGPSKSQRISISIDDDTHELLKAPTDTQDQVFEAPESPSRRDEVEAAESLVLMAAPAPEPPAVLPAEESIVDAAGANVEVQCAELTGEAPMVLICVGSNLQAHLEFDLSGFTSGRDDASPSTAQADGQSAEPADAMRLDPSQPLVLSGEFVKQGQHFPWTWRKRAFELTVDKESHKPRLSYYENALRKGSLEIKGVRLPSAEAKRPNTSMTLSSDEQQAPKPKPAAFEVVFEAADGQRQLLARADSEEERQQWIETTNRLLAAIA